MAAWPARGLEPGTNVCVRGVIQAGDAEAGLQVADIVVEKTYTFPCIFHGALEPHGAVGHVQADRITVWSNGGDLYQLRQELAEMFSLGLDRIRVVVPYAGGRFGSRTRRSSSRASRS